MITPDYCQAMARYNAWQNIQIAEALKGQPRDVLTLERGAFFGSILGTLSHLLWGDLMWMARFSSQVARPDGTIATSARLVADLPAWRQRRGTADRAITDWAAQVTAEALTGDLVWFSGAARQEVRRPLAFCVAHMFNHQTHHRGQVHALMTEAGLTAPVSDLFLTPEVA